MVTYRLRPATPDDSDILYLIHRAAMGEYLEQAFGPWTEEFDREQHEQWLSAGRARVILVGDEIAGVLDVEWQADVAVLYRIGIDPTFQGRGLGTAIVRDLLRECGERQLPARLHVFPHNPARRLYQRLGFREVGSDSASIVMRWDPPGRQPRGPDRAAGQRS